MNAELVSDLFVFCNIDSVSLLSIACIFNALIRSLFVCFYCTKKDIKDQFYKHASFVNYTASLIRTTCKNFLNRKTKANLTVVSFG
jgi:hypothetical protein